MVTAQRLMRYVGAEPFRRFRISMTSGQSLDINHPEMVSVGRSKAHINFFMSDDAEQVKERVREVLLMQMESIEPLEPITSERRMLTPESLRGYVKAEPFRPFRLHLASGRTFDVRHPEMLKILKSSVLVFKINDQTSDITDEWESVSLMLTESVSHLEAAVR